MDVDGDDRGRVMLVVVVVADSACQCPRAKFGCLANSESPNAMFALFR